MLFLVYVTTADQDEAKRLARDAVAEKLAACANILDGVSSIYRWQGEVCEGSESLLILKTTEDRLQALIGRLTAAHSYDLPCITALPISSGNPDFLNWIVAETTS